MGQLESMVKVATENQAILPILQKDRVAASYHIISREDNIGNLKPNIEWILINNQALIMIYRDKRVLPLGDPLLLARAFEDETIRAMLPGRFTAVVKQDEEAVLGDEWLDFTGKQSFIRLALTKEAYTPRQSKKQIGQTIPLGVEHLAQIQRLLTTSYQANAFRPNRLDSGFYFGAINGDEIIAMAGIHGIARAEKLAILGDGVTDVRFRNMGLVYNPTCAVLSKLFSQGINLVVVNVLAENAPSLHTVRNYGFQDKFNISEISCVKKAV